VQGYLKYLFAIGSALIIIIVYFTTYWRIDLKGSSISVVFDILMIWIFISMTRSILEMRAINDAIPFVFSNYMGLALFPVLFFILGINPNYFYPINKLISIYIFFAFIFSLIYIQSFELQLYLVYPLFFIILTIPLRTTWGKILIVVISIVVIAVSLTNRAGILRILFSYSIVVAFYVLQYVRINKKLLYSLVFIVLLIPVVALYLGIQGQSIFQVILGDDDTPYSQLNPYADTRTFLYYEVLQDLQANDAFLFGKGLNAGYNSASFQTYNREVVEVGFLQILMKTGIVGFILYISIIVSAVFKAIGKSRNLFIKALGLLLTGYIIMLFIENQIAYNLLNIIIWLVVGICHSEKLRKLDDREIKRLYQNKSN
jgi:O-antigen ligase